MFISRRPLGLIATPGTYLSVEAYSTYAETRIISHSIINSSDIIVHQPSMKLDMKKIDFTSKDVLKLIQSEVKLFSPDFVCIGCFSPEKNQHSTKNGWSDVAKCIKAVRPTSKVVLEVKSPLLLSGDRLLKMQKRMGFGQLYLDAVIAPAIGMVETWLPSLEVPFLEHRSIIDCKGIRVNLPTAEKIFCRKIIFSGSLEKKRKIDELLKLIAKLPAELRMALTFDFYGEGTVKGALVRLTEELGLNEIVNFNGSLLQKDLFEIYCQYDAGLAWVPKEKYDSAPSLKLSEYCAAGLIPIATNTKGHDSLKAFGFQLEIFEETEVSFSATMEKIFYTGFHTSSIKKNLQLVQKSDYRTVIKDEILPFYQKLSLVGGQSQASWSAVRNRLLGLCEFRAKAIVPNLFSGLLKKIRGYFQSFGRNIR